MNSGIAVVTGANKGLGYSTVKQLCKKYKGTVYLTSRDEKRGIEAFEKLKTSRDNLQYYHQLDVSDENSIKEFCKHLEKERKTIDILVNNAGVLFLKDSKEPKLYQAEQTVLINFFALVNFTEAVLPFINDNASIVNISSSSGHLSRVSDSLRSRISDPNLSLDGLKQLMKEYIDDVKLNKEVEKDWGETPYVVSKVAVNAYTFQLNRRLKNRGIRVNCVHPGYVISDMTRGAGKVTPDLAAGLVVTVAMETAGGTYVWSNGQRVSWDGTDPRGYIDNSAKVVQPSLLSME